MSKPKHSKRIADKKRQNRRNQGKTGPHDWKEYAPEEEPLDTGIDLSAASRYNTNSK